MYISIYLRTYTHAYVSCVIILPFFDLTDCHPGYRPGGDLGLRGWLLGAQSLATRNGKHVETHTHTDIYIYIHIYIYVYIYTHVEIHIDMLWMVTKSCTI